MFFGTYIDTNNLDYSDVVINTRTPVYITLSTIPSRISNTVILVKHFLKYVRGFEKIIVNIPYRYERWPNLRANVVLFDDIVDPRFTLNRCTDDGPLTKLTGSLDLIPPNSITLICDDMCYNLSAFKEIAEKQDKELHKAFSFYVYKFNNGGRDVSVPQGADIITIHSKSLANFTKWRQGLINNLKLMEYSDTKCFYVDDLVIGWYLRMMGIPLEQVEREHRMIYIKNCEYSPLGDGLNRQTGENSRKNTMNQCYVDLNTFNPL